MATATSTAGNNRGYNRSITLRELQVPTFYDPSNAWKRWTVPYEERAEQAFDWAARNNITPAASDTLRVRLMLIDEQITFCLPPDLGGQLYVVGAEADTDRVAQFIYRNLAHITSITATMDTHTSLQIFFARFWVDAQGKHPPAVTMISRDDVHTGKWRVNPSVAAKIGWSYDRLAKHVRHYVDELTRKGKFALLIWPIHARLGDESHALVSTISEAIHVHECARDTEVDFQIKGGNPLTEFYSVLRPEVMTTAGGVPIDQENVALLNAMEADDVLVFAGQAKSHCLNFTIDDVMSTAERWAQNAGVAVGDILGKIYILEDCTSPVIVPGPNGDFTQLANEAFDRYKAAGMHIVRSTDPMESWPGMQDILARAAARHP